ncbi:GerAB/ArcD/ProY family transporter [Brevibacillus marinus]|uniref:GerAB/ArcD/ProY family transporter n=1 Tax=Brevibacillus marinus TaxID=2496837 RepID=UPI000F8184CA|nr:endospore germination permease [Brevibacillus marinus]
MSKHDAIGMLQASMLIITAIGILDHVIIIPLLLEAAGRDSWFAVLLAGILLHVWIPLIFFIMKRSGQQQLFSWLKERIGAPLACCIIALIVTDLFLMVTTTMRDVSYWTNITYLPTIPNVILVLCYTLISFYAAHSGLRSIAIVNGLLLPIVVILGFFVMTSNFPHKDYSLLFPLFEHGYKPIFLGMLYAGSGFSGIFYLVYMQHRLQTKVKLFPLMLTGFILVELTLSPLTGAIAAFGPDEASRMRFPSYEQWRLITFGHFVEHVDFFSIYQWLVGAFIRLSLGIFLIPELLNLKGKQRTRLMVGICVLMVAATQLPLSDLTFLSFLSVYQPASLFVVLLVSVVLAAVAGIQKKRVKA